MRNKREITEAYLAMAAAENRAAKAQQAEDALLMTNYGVTELAAAHLVTIETQREFQQAAAHYDQLTSQSKPLGIDWSSEPWPDECNCSGACDLCRGTVNAVLDEPEQDCGV
jgi:hypothetical protein